MNAHHFTFCGAELAALGTGALWWPAADLLCVSDLHLAKSERMARRGGTLLPPYETRDTLARLEADLAATEAGRIACLGDSFDGPAGVEVLAPAEAAHLARLTASRDWVWLAGNHDPGAVAPGGRCGTILAEGALTFRHVAAAGSTGEVSGHYHPKLRLRIGGRRLSRPCFLIDATRVILPAYGTYTGGLDADAPPLSDLVGPAAQAVPTGRTPRPFPAASAGPPRQALTPR